MGKDILDKAQEVYSKLLNGDEKITIYNVLNLIDEFVNEFADMLENERYFYSRTFHEIIDLIMEIIKLFPPFERQRLYDELSRKLKEKQKQNKSTSKMIEYICNEIESSALYEEHSM